ncbi:MAG: AgmX/PglI C-terminal domain-containing protein [Deltaproteobacteria bacterium]|nr:AgmX/PglI C-terminal domain-containing protein [Deltaproteobacteria bacterium]
MLFGFAHGLAVASFLSVSRANAALGEELYSHSVSTTRHILVPVRARPIPHREARRSDKPGPIARASSRKSAPSSRVTPDARGLGEMLSAISRLVRGTDDGELARALGGVQGPTRAALGVSDAAARGEGSAFGPEGGNGKAVDLGVLHTGGRGGGDANDYGNAGSLGAKVERDPIVSQGTVVVEGGLDRELIRRIVEDHKVQVRYCYERELITSPGLFGKVDLEWVIDSEGHVSSTDVKSSTLSNPSVERCLRSKISSWIFPKPRGGGVVVVRYPFAFRAR